MFRWCSCHVWWCFGHVLVVSWPCCVLFRLCFVVSRMFADVSSVFCLCLDPVLWCPCDVLLVSRSCFGGVSVMLRVNLFDFYDWSGLAVCSLLSFRLLLFRSKCKTFYFGIPQEHAKFPSFWARFVLEVFFGAILMMCVHYALALISFGNWPECIFQTIFCRLRGKRSLRAIGEHF